MRRAAAGSEPHRFLVSTRPNRVGTLVQSTFPRHNPFYRCYTGLGVLKLVTAGGYSVRWLIELMLIVTGTLKDPEGNELQR